MVAKYLWKNILGAERLMYELLYVHYMNTHYEGV